MKDNRRKSILYRYVIFGFGIVMVLFCLFIGFWTVEKARQIESKRMEEENFLLVLTMEDVENGMESLKQISDQIIVDDTITPYRLRKGGYYTVEALQKLKYYCQGTDVFEDLLICLNNENVVYRTNGMEQFSILTGRAFTLGGTLTLENLYALLDSKDRYGFLNSTDSLVSEKKPYNMITYPLYSADMNIYGTLTGLMEVSFLQDALKESELTSETIICNNEGKILFTTGDHEKLSLQLLEMLREISDEEHFYTVKEEQTTYRAVAYQADVTGWYYIRLIDQKDLAAMLWKEILPSVGMLFMLAMITSGMIGVLIAFYCYLPVKSLLHLFNPDIAYSAKRDELSLINQYVKNLQKESISMKEQINRRNLQQIREVLTEVLYGGGGVNNAELELFERYGFQEQTSEFCIILLMPQEEIPELETDYRMPMLKEKCVLFITREIGGGYICLYCARKGTQSAMEQCSELHEYYTKAGYQMRISLGGYVEGFSELRDSLNECLLAAELDKESPIVCLNSSFTGNVQEFWRPCKKELLLELAIRSGDKAEIIKKSTDLERELSSVMRYYLSSEMQYVFYRIMNYLVVQFRDTGIKEEFAATFQEMRDSKDVTEFFDSFRRCAQVVFEESSTPVNEAKYSKIKEIKEFIDGHAYLPEMSLSYIADHFGIRDSYLSKLFKESMGENFIDYLLRLRLEEAARLLRETDMTVKQVVNQVGYEDATSFAKRFSKKYGMTPGVYKKTLSHRNRK